MCRSLVCAVLFSVTPLQAADWISSTASEPWKHRPLDASPADVVTSPIKLDANTVFQKIDGFGGCFNELGWQALLALDETKRAEALEALFAPTGANFTLGRVPIGANDFSLKWYSLDETPDDFAMDHFSIAHDRENLIPFLKAAMKYQPRLAVWGVPWSPPAWMKTNGHYKGGRIKADARNLAAYALYFEKWVQAYRSEGVDVFGVMPQNEPNYNDNIYPQCRWSGPELNGFLRDHLLPRLKQDGVKVEVWLGTICCDVPEFVGSALDDRATAPGIVGIAFQYGGQGSLGATHTQHPDKKLMQSETECYKGENTWDQGMATFHKIVDDTRNFAGSYFFWNTVLNEGGTSTWNWRQNSLLTIDRKTDIVRYNPEFYAMKHFSSLVLPGAERIAVGGPFKDLVAFRNPSGTKVIVFANESNEPQVTALEIGGVYKTLRVPARSMNTVVLDEE